MARLEYFVVSESVAIDQQTNRISIFHVLEEIAKGPAGLDIVPAVAIVVAWNLDREDIGQDFGVTVRVHSPGGQQRDFQINFTAARERQRSILRIQGLPIEALGLLRFEVLLNGEHQAWHNVTVREARPEEIAPFAPS